MTNGSSEFPSDLEGPPDDEASVDALVDDIGMLGIGSRVFPPELDFEIFDDKTVSLSPGLDESMSVEARIRDLEERLDGLIGMNMPTSTDGLDPSPSLPNGGTKATSEEAVYSTRELLTSDYYRKQWGRQALRTHVGGVDDFGLDPSFENKATPWLEFLYRRYFRVEVKGLENVPESGRAVIVANHSGALPLDGLMLRQALRQTGGGGRDLRWLAEDFTFYLPFIGVAMNRLGAVRACPENAQRLLENEHLVAVFPEGAEGIKKLFKKRYQLQRFGRGGFVRLCLTTGSPIVPCAIVGAEETNPILYRFDNLPKLVGLDYLPVTPAFPALGPVGLLPAPTKWRIVFGEPISVADFGPESAADHVLVGRLSERVQTAIQGLLDDALAKRKSVWF